MKIDEKLNILVDAGLADFANEEAREITLNEDDWVDRPEVDGFAIDPEKTNGLIDAEQIFKVSKVNPGIYEISVSFVDTDAIFSEYSFISLLAMARVESQFDNKTNQALETMMPKEITYNSGSFIPGERRPAVTVQMTYDAHSGQITEKDMFLSVATNRRQLSIEEADEQIRDGRSLEEFGQWQDYLSLANSLLSHREGEESLELLQHRLESGKNSKTPAEHIVKEIIGLANKQASEIALEKEMVILSLDFTEAAKRAVSTPIAIMDNPETGVSLYGYDEDGNPIYDPPVSSSAKRDFDDINMPEIKLSTPVRQFIAYINNRFVTAHLKGEPSPYEDILGELTEYLQEYMKNGRKEQKRLNKIRKLREGYQQLGWDFPDDWQSLGEETVNQMYADVNREQQIRQNLEKLERIGREFARLMEVDWQDIEESGSDLRKKMINDQINKIYKTDPEQAAKFKLIAEIWVRQDQISLQRNSLEELISEEVSGLKGIKRDLYQISPLR